MGFSAATICSGLENPLSTRVVWACGAITAEKTPNAGECFVHSGTCDEKKLQEAAGLVTTGNRSNPDSTDRSLRRTAELRPVATAGQRPRLIGQTNADSST